MVVLRDRVVRDIFSVYIIIFYKYFLLIYLVFLKILGGGNILGFFYIMDRKIGF